MNADIGKSSCAAAKRSAMHRKTKNVIRREQKFDGVQSIVGCVQIFGDKSQILLAAGSLKFCLLHITLLSFAEKFRKHCILSEASIVANLPIFFKAPCLITESNTPHVKEN